MRFVRAVIIIAVCMSLSCAYAGIFFDNPNLDADDNVIFTVRNTNVAASNYASLFLLNLNSENYEHDVELLTYYPEYMSMINGNSILQIRNRLGTANFDTEKKTFSWIKKNWKTQNDFALIGNLRPSVYATSPNGKWFCYFEKTGAVTGNVVMEDALSSAKVVIMENVPLSYERVPVEWAGDSSALFYEKNGAIYFLSPEPFFRGIEADEQNRKIGDGKISSVFAVDKFLFYINGDCVYRINTRELYTLGLYSEIIGTGTPVGRLADVFLPKMDYFSVSPKMDSLAVIRGGKTIAVYSLPKSGSNFLPITCYRPYINDNGSVVDSRVIWAKDGNLSVWFMMMSYDGGDPFSVVNKISGQNISPVLNIANFIPPVISPDKAQVIVATENSLRVYDASTWDFVAELHSEKIVSAVWASTNEIFAGGENTLRKWQLAQNTAEVVALSSVSICKWDHNEVTATSGERQYVYDKETGAWAVPSPDLYVASSVQNGRYRVYVGESTNPKYDNAIYLRTLSHNPGTRAVFSESVSRNGEKKLRKVAIIFDAYDSPDGLAQILSVMHKFNLRSTFFLNGEFIKRYPTETRQISKSGNECASMFFTMSNLTDVNFNVNESFVRRGLARTEDLFYQVTGKELSLLWHAPFYDAMPEIKIAAKKAGYIYVEPSILPVGNATLEQAISSLHYEPSADIVKNIIDMLIKNHGGCVPVSIGILHGTRTDYLYNYIEMLVCAILDAGFEIVPASSLR